MPLIGFLQVIEHDRRNALHVIFCFDQREATFLVERNGGLVRIDHDEFVTDIRQNVACCYRSNELIKFLPRLISVCWTFRATECAFVKEGLYGRDDVARTTKDQIDASDVGGGTSKRGYFRWAKKGNMMTVKSLSVTDKHSGDEGRQIILKKI
jgi:hypothetical protein